MMKRIMIAGLLAGLLLGCAEEPAPAPVDKKVEQPPVAVEEPVVKETPIVVKEQVVVEEPAVEAAIPDYPENTSRL